LLKLPGIVYLNKAEPKSKFFLPLSWHNCTWLSCGVSVWYIN